MSKRLQVLLPDAEWRATQRAARERSLTVAEWVRGALRVAREREPLGDPSKKLQAVRAGARHAFPTGDIEQMRGEIERGYLQGAPADLS